MDWLTISLRISRFVQARISEIILYNFLRVETLSLYKVDYTLIYRTVYQMSLLLANPYYRLLDNLVVESWLRVWEAPGSIPSLYQITLITASSITQWQSAGFECGMSRVQAPVKDRLLDSLVVECQLRVWDVQGSIPSQGPRHTKDVIKMVPVVPLFSVQH